MTHQEIIASANKKYQKNSITNADEVIGFCKGKEMTVSYIREYLEQTEFNYLNGDLIKFAQDLESFINNI